MIPSFDRTHPVSQWNGPPVALFWDQSLVWGLICLDTLERLEVPFHLLCAEDIARGHLDGYRVLLVPGGWASHKVRVLGKTGAARIRRFLDEGGSYLGFCGGAGLALSSPPALGLVPFERLPLAQRLPNASGDIWIRGVTGHPVWHNLPQDLPVCIWWPSQFSWQPLPRSLCLAAYQAPGADFWVADLPVADMQEGTRSWRQRERSYGINLDPTRLLGEPAIFEVRSGKGRLILSYPHMETPNSPWGNRLFLNTLQYLDQKAACGCPQRATPAQPQRPRGHLNTSPGNEIRERLSRIQQSVDDLIGFGERHLLWKWHLPWLLRWQRGIRGLEYGTLAVAVRVLSREAKIGDADCVAPDPWLEPVLRLEEDVRQFCPLAKTLLLEEKLAAQAGRLTKLGKVNETVDNLRSRLFGGMMNHGGLSRTIFDRLDRLLLHLLRQGWTGQGRGAARSLMEPVAARSYST